VVEVVEQIMHFLQVKPVVQVVELVMEQVQALVVLLVQLDREIVEVTEVFLHLMPVVAEVPAL
jgi:hypothetical protein